MSAVGHGPFWRQFEGSTPLNLICLSDCIPDLIYIFNVMRRCSHYLSIPITSQWLQTVSIKNPPICCYVTLFKSNAVFVRKVATLSVEVPKCVLSLKCPTFPSSARGREQCSSAVWRWWSQRGLELYYSIDRQLVPPHYCPHFRQMKQISHLYFQ